MGYAPHPTAGCPRPPRGVSAIRAPLEWPPLRPEDMREYTPLFRCSYCRGLIERDRVHCQNCGAPAEEGTPARTVTLPPVKPRPLQKIPLSPPPTSVPGPGRPRRMTESGGPL